MQRVAEHVRRSPSAGVIIMSFKRWIICCSWTYFKINCFSSSSSSPSHRLLFLLFISSSQHTIHTIHQPAHTQTRGRIGRGGRLDQQQDFLPNNNSSHIIHIVLVLCCVPVSPLLLMQCVLCWLTKNMWMSWLSHFLRFSFVSCGSKSSSCHQHSSQTPQHPSFTNLQRFSSDEMKKKYIIQFITVFFWYLKIW